MRSVNVQHHPESETLSRWGGGGGAIWRWEAGLGKIRTRGLRTSVLEISRFGRLLGDLSNCACGAALRVTCPAFLLEMPSSDLPIAEGGLQMAREAGTVYCVHCAVPGPRRLSELVLSVDLLFYVRRLTPRGPCVRHLWIAGRGECKAGREELVHLFGAARPPRTSVA